MRTHYRMVTLSLPTSHFVRRGAAAQVIAVGEPLNVGLIRGRPPRPGRGSGRRGSPLSQRGPSTR